jgi:L-seryl-tRNA(Ser) seleniumtransferase
MSVRTDRFGNPVDPTVSYARGTILAGELEESLRQRHGFELVRAFFARGGDSSVYNLTGLIRGFPLQDPDDEWLKSYIHFNARADGQLERVALKILGGDEAEHDGFLSNRVSAGILAVMLTVLAENDLVLSLVPADRSHPSIRSAVHLARGRFEEVIGVAAFEAAYAGGIRPKLVVITTIGPSKHHMDAPEVLRAIKLARQHGAMVMLDDAHMAARLAWYEEVPGLALGAPDLVVWSLDKHLGGPRSGFVAGRKDLIRRVRARAFALGLEAQPALYMAGLHALEAWDPQVIREAGEMARRCFEPLQKLTGGRTYMAGPGLAVGGEDLLELALERAGGGRSALVPVEAVAVASFAMMERDGIVTIPVAGMPGAASVFRLMMFPDGSRLGDDRLLSSARHAIDTLAAVVGDARRARVMLLGAA